MKTITIGANDNESWSVQMENTINGEPCTVNDLCCADAVTDAFDADAEDVKAAVTALDGTDIPGAFRTQMFAAAINDGAVVDIDMDVVNRPAPAANEGATGHVTVNTSGGLNSCQVEIVNGRTTVRQAIFNDTVRRSSGQNDTQLSSCSVMLNEVAVDPALFDTKTVSDGDVITMSPLAPHTKG